MSVLPPPVPPQSPPVDHATGSNPDAVLTTGEAPPEAAPGDPRHGLSVTWRWVLAAGWSVIMSALGAIAQSAFLADTGPFWLSVKPLPFALPVLTLLALVGNWRATLWVSLVAAVGTVGVGIGDLVEHYRAVSVTEFVCGASALLLTLAAALSRPRRATPEPART